VVLAYKETTMTIRQTRTHTPPTGHSVLVSMVEWAETLSPTDKLEFYKGYRYQQSREKTFSALGHLTISEVSAGTHIYSWDNQSSIDKCGVDPLYTQYHNRYLTETGITYNATSETV